LSEHRAAPVEIEPRVGRPRLPRDYGVPESNEGTLPWQHAVDRLTAAKNYWVGTTRPDGRPHASPIWGVWLDGAFYFDGSPETRRGRNLAENPSIVVHLESGDEVVILEGEAHAAGRPERALAERVAAAYRAKYERHGYAPQPEQWDEGGLYVMRPRTAFAWTTFPTDMTRWRFPGA
jgi:nitroimidazol reductase NimA-like FMN-containing flavoprotein (pyridoxamine 5'-phosphate oxidase superfamily)